MAALPSIIAPVSRRLCKFFGLRFQQLIQRRLYAPRTSSRICQLIASSFSITILSDMLPRLLSECVFLLPNSCELCPFIFSQLIIPYPIFYPFLNLLNLFYLIRLNRQHTCIHHQKHHAFTAHTFKKAIELGVLEC